MYFGLLGPIFGGVAVFPLVVLSRWSLSVETVLQALLAAVFGTVLSVSLLPLTLILGVIPATITGFLYWLWRRKLPRKPRATVCAVVGALLGLTVCLVGVLIVDRDLASVFAREAWAVAILPGAFAGLVCALVVERKIWTTRETASEPGNQAPDDPPERAFESRSKPDQAASKSS